jgi:outer membrane receptor protein involved in Fe transport
LGNPDIDPEVNVSYELGLKTQITKDFALTLAAFNNNRFDYIVSRSVITRDQTGRPVTKTMFINQDYAKIAGLELGINYRLGKYFRQFGNIAYQVARGKSNTARESALQIAQNGEVQLSREQFLAFDRPWNINVGMVFAPDSTLNTFGVNLTGLQVFISYAYTSGFRYTPLRQIGAIEVREGVFRPEFVREDDRFLQGVASGWNNFDIRATYDWSLGKNTGLVFSVEIRNAFNNKNAQIINPVTGRAYEFGDDVPNEWRDPRPEYNGPQESGVDPRNPARYLPPRQVLYGVAFRF